MDSDDAYGRQERAKAVRQAILGFLKGRFTKVPEEVRDLLRDVWEEAPLQTLAVSAGTAESLQAFTARLRRKAGAARSARDRDLSAGLLQDAIQATLRARFGPVPIDARWGIEGIKDRKALESLHVVASRCGGWEDFRHFLGDRGARHGKVRRGPR